MKRIDGIYLVKEKIKQVEKTLAKPEVKKKVAWGTTIILGLGIILLTISTFYPIFGVQATINTNLVKNQSFSQDVKPEFILDSAGLISSQEKKQGQKELKIDNSKITAKLSLEGQETDINPKITSLPENKDQFQIKIPYQNQFSPGKYELTINLDTPTKDQTITQDFTWGVLAINPDQSIYQPGQEAFLAMAVLDDQGEMVCDAEVILEIKDPNNHKTVLSTKSGKIKVSDQCQHKGVTNLPDYYTYYQTSQAGQYQMKLWAKTENGIRTLEDNFLVENDPDFIVKRNGPTRIYPPADYQMKLTIKAKENSQAQIKEFVPGSFSIQPSSDFIITNQGSEKILTWQIKLKKDQKKTLKYTFKTPMTSPQFYLLGKLKIKAITKKTISEKITIDLPTIQEPVESKPDLEIPDQEQEEELSESLPTDNADLIPDESGKEQPQEKKTINKTRLVKEKITWQENRYWQIAADLTNTKHPTAYTVTTGFNGNFNDASYPASNAYANDSTYASTGFSDKRNKEYATNWRGFDFSGIPDGATINSVNVYVDRKTSYANGKAEWRSTVWADVTVAAALAPGSTGSIGNTQYTTSTNPTSDAYWNYSMSTLPSVAQLKGSNFGLRVQIVNDNDGTDLEYFIDDIYIVVDYTAAATYSITGTVYGTDESTPVVTGPLVRVKVNGLGDYSANANGSGVYNVTGITASEGNAITVYLDTGGGITGATFTIFTGANMTNIHINQDRATIRCDNSCSLTNANINQWDKGNDPDIHAASDGTNLVVDNDWKLLIAADTYAPAGTATLSTGGSNSYSGDLEIKSGTTLNMASNALSISGNYANGGTATLSSNTTSFTKTSGTQTLNSGGTGTGKLFNNLTHSGAGTVQLSTNAIDIDGTFNQTAGTFDCNSQNQNFAGDLSLSLGTTFTKGGALTFDGSTQVLTDATAAPGQDLGAVTIGPSTATSLSTTNKMHTTTLTSGTGANDTLDISNDTLTIRGTGTPFTKDGTFTIASSTVVYAGTTATNVTTTQYNNLTFTPESGTPSYTIIDHLTGTEAMTGNMTISANATLDDGFGYNIDLDGNWTNNGTLTTSSGTVTLSGTGLQTLSGTMTGASSFHNLTITNTSGSFSGCEVSFTPGIDFAASATISNNYTITGAARVEYNSASTYTATNVNWNGGGTDMVFRNSTLSSGTWLLDVSGTQTAVIDIDVGRSDANTGNEIDASDGTSVDCNNNINWKFTSNTIPNDPSSLAQKKTDDTVLATGDWTDETSVKYTATVTDPDTDQVRLCVEKDNLATGFSDTEDLCGDLVNSGNTASVTITSQADDTEYHWQARAKDSNDDYSSWVSYDINAENERDYGIDTSAPTGGSVNDGTGGDQDWNDGTLDSISANWSGFDATVSDLDKYEYAVRRASNDYYWNAGGSTWQAGESWVDNGVSTSKTVNTIYLHTGESYYFSIKATDNASSTGTPVDSDGQQILPTLGFSYDTNTITFDDLNNGNNWTDTETNTFTSSTNAYSGYTIMGYLTQDLTSIAYPSETITGFYGTWANPELWTGSDYGFGYTSNDILVQGSNRFQGGTEYAKFSQTAPGDIVADHTDAIDGSTGAVSSEQFIITYKVSVEDTQPASTYQTYAIYVLTANY